MSENTERENQAAQGNESQRQAAQATMLEEALRQPGIREMMMVYEDWRTADSGLETYRAATKEPMSITTTDHANT